MKEKDKKKFSIPLFILLLFVSGSVLVCAFDVIEESNINRIDKALEKCEWGLIEHKYPLGVISYTCKSPPCREYNIKGLNCVEEGLSGGFLDMSPYYICEGYGRIKLSCVEYYTTDTWLEDKGTLRM